MNRVLPLLFLSLLLVWAPHEAQAEARWVTDQASIMMRTGESTKHKIIRSLPSGEAVEELTRNEATGYSRVRTADGVVGFVLTRQLQEQPAARDRLAEMEARLAELQQAPDQLAARLERLQTAYDELQISQETLRQDRDELREQVATIDRATSEHVNIYHERMELEKENRELKTRIEDLNAAIAALNNRNELRWFLSGAGAVLGGVLIGLILPNLRIRRRRSSWRSSL